MIVFDDITTTYFDVDDTLVMWGEGYPDEDRIVVTDGYGPISLYPHKYHIAELKTRRAHGHRIVVWSQGGADWAHKVVVALGLENYVDLVINKPHEYFDDIDASYFMRRRYITLDER